MVRANCPNRAPYRPPHAGGTLPDMNRHTIAPIIATLIASTTACSSGGSPASAPAPSAIGTTANVKNTEQRPAAAETPPAAAFPVTAVVTACTSAGGRNTAAVTATNTGTVTVHTALVVTIDGRPALTLVRADSHQPPFSPAGIELTPGASWRGSASLPDSGGVPVCSVTAGPAG